MKKIKYSSVAYLLVALALFTSSCKKVLEQEPKNSTYADVYWQNVRDLKSAIAGNYALVRDAITSKNNRYYMYGEAIAKNYFTIQYNGDGLEGIQNGNFTFQYNVISLGSLGDWTKYYKAIAMSNTILKRVPEVPEDKLGDVSNATQFKNEIIGQALFLRAWTYFMMVRVWGDVPIVTEAYDDPLSAPHLGRNPKEEVMKLIEDDCHAAASLLRWGYTNIGDAKVTANKGSVYALLTHLYMWRATMSDLSSATPKMADINSADTTIAALMTNGGYSLTDTANYYETFIGSSNESIFELNMSENTMEGSQESIGMQFLSDTRLKNWNGANPRFHVAPSYLNTHFLITPAQPEGWYWNELLWQWEWLDERPAVYDSMDVRYRKNFDYVHSLKPECIKYKNVIYRNPGQLLQPYLSNNMIIFRLADMMLLKAEIALYKNDQDGAIDIINFFRIKNGAKKSGTPDENLILEHGMAKEDVMYEYILERGKELYLEGHIFYDMLRTREYKIVDWLDNDDGTRFKTGGFYWPVSPLLFKLNPLLKQTPYWVGKV